MGSIVATFVIESFFDYFSTLMDFPAILRFISFFLFIWFFGRTFVFAPYIFIAPLLLKGNYKTERPLEKKDLNLTASIIVTAFLVDNIYFLFGTLLSDLLIKVILTALVIPIFFYAIYRLYVSLSRYLPPHF